MTEPRDTETLAPLEPALIADLLAATAGQHGSRRTTSILRSVLRR